MVVVVVVHHRRRIHLRPTATQMLCGKHGLWRPLRSATRYHGWKVLPFEDDGLLAVPRCRRGVHLLPLVMSILTHVLVLLIWKYGKEPVAIALSCRHFKQLRPPVRVGIVRLHAPAHLVLVRMHLILKPWHRESDYIASSKHASAHWEGERRVHVRLGMRALLQCRGVPGPSVVG